MYMYVWYDDLDWKMHILVSGRVYKHSYIG